MTIQHGARLRRGGTLAYGATIVRALVLVAASPFHAGVASGADDAQRPNWTEGAFDIPDPASGAAGGKIYLASCASCHDEGLGRAPQRAMFTLMSASSVYKALTDGLMKAQGQELSDADRRTVSEFLTRQDLTSASAAQGPSACAADAAKFDPDDVPPHAGWGMTRQNTRFVPAEAAGLDRRNIGRLRLKWAFGFPGALRVRSQPGLGGGAVYVGSHGGAVYALNRESGCVRWMFQIGSEVRTAIVLSPWRRGDTAARPRAYFGDIVGNVYALDARDGTLVWRRTVETHPNATITGTPVLYGERLYVPVSSHEVLRPSDPNYACCTFRGSIVALDAGTGDLVWRSYTIPTEATLRGHNGAGAEQYGPSGAPVWNSPGVDERRRQLFFGTGENYSSPADSNSDAIKAIDLESGAIRWSYQATAGDAWNTSCDLPDRTSCPVEEGPDLDFGAGVILARSTQGREFVIGGQKAGVVHALDPDTGRLIWRTRVGRGGILGGVYFGMAVSGDKLLVPVNDGEDGRTYAQPPRPGLSALDVMTGRTLWSIPAETDKCEGRALCGPGYAQAITATPQLVAVGAGDGWLRIFDVDDGSLLWRFDTTQTMPTVGGGSASGGSFGGGAGPVIHRGMLFASSGYGFAGQMPGNVLLAFAVE